MSQNFGNQEPWPPPQGNNTQKSSLLPSITSFIPTTLGVFLQLIFIFLGVFFLYKNSTQLVLPIVLFFMGLIVFFACVIWQVGTSVKIATDAKPRNIFSFGIECLLGQIKLDSGLKRAPATELALGQFLSQVRSYANEKIYQRNKPSQEVDSGKNLYPNRLVEPSDLLKRRWNEVLDTLNEFEIYLSNHPKTMIENLVSKYPNQVSDVSQVFQDVAESFDNTWRRKGITIESAIVKPLKANTNEALLRRILVGPWRTCVFFARRGNAVMFSAKSVAGKIVTRWECEGMGLSDSLLAHLMNSDLSVNSRIDKGLQEITGDHSSSGILFALISFVIWIDLVKEAKIDFEIKPSNEGTVIELRL
jgi:hypothetical protein